MIFAALIIAFSKLAYFLACALVLASVVLAFLRIRQFNLRNFSLLLLSSAFLVIALCYIPHLTYYIMYGIQSKVLRSSHIIFGAVFISLAFALFIKGRDKWAPVVAIPLALIAFVLA